MISQGDLFQNGTAHIKSGQPVLKLATDFKSGRNIIQQLENYVFDMDLCNIDHYDSFYTLCLLWPLPIRYVHKLH